jgi:hypothetical protein
MAIKHWYAVACDRDTYRLIDESSQILINRTEDLASLSLDLIFFTWNKWYDNRKYPYLKIVRLITFKRVYLCD